MSIPINEFVFVGVWNATTSYRQFQFVQSPIDTLCYVNVNIQPSLGGADPSVQPSAYWVLLNQPSASGITSLNGLTDPAMSLISSDLSVSITPIAPNQINLTTSGTGFPPAYGSFSCSIPQALPQSSELITFYDTKDCTSVGLTVLIPTTFFTVDYKGVYKILSSIQTDRTAGGLSTITMYPKINGNAVPNSATRLVINQNFEDVLTVEWFLDMNAGDNLEIAVYTTDLDNQLLAVPATPPLPAIPSIITTILRIA